MRSFKGFTVVLQWVVVLLLLLGGQPAAWGQTLQNCGNEGEAPCPLSFTNARCDTGLRLSLPKKCGCLLRGPFGGCLFPRFCTTCVDFTRRRFTIDAFVNGWVDWALRNQRDLAIDEPLNWVMHLGTHNSFNTRSDGHTFFPNHFYSITDALRSGARLLTLDLHYLPYKLGPARLCHGGDKLLGTLCALLGNSLIYPRPPGLRYYANGIKEIRNWLQANPSEIVFIGLENYVLTEQQGGATEDVLDPLRAYLGHLLLDPPLPSPPSFDQPRWPTRREMLAAGRRVIVTDDSGDTTNERVFKQVDTQGPFNDGWFAKHLSPFPNCARFAFWADASTDIFTTDISTASFSNGDLVVLKELVDSSLPTGVSEDTTYYVVNASRENNKTTFQLAATEDGSPIDLTADEKCKDDEGGDEYCAIVTKSPTASTTVFSIVVEDRSGFTVIPRFNPGQLEAEDIAIAAECNVSFITLDFFSSSLPEGRVLNLPDFSRQKAAVWSWKENDRGQNGDCAMLEASSGRWVSANCEAPRPFACAKPRSESGLDPLEWEDPLGEQWKVTEASGHWEDGDAFCRAKFPGYVFGVPVNGYQNRKLKDTNSAGRDLWLNYSQRNVKGKWVIGRLSDVNSPPVAEAGPDQVLQCGSMVKLDGSASSDADGDPLTYTWAGSFGTLTGPVVNTALGLGTHAITLTVNDGKGGTDTDTVTVLVRDTTPPSMTLALSPEVLWPANHQLVDVAALIDAKDSCDTELPSVELVSIASSDSNDGSGDGKSSRDIQGAEIGADDRQLQLRAERAGKGVGRVYTVTYRAIDLSGNATTMSTQVTVPHDRGKRGSGR